MSTDKMKASECLDNAIQALETYGWIQGDHGNNAHGYCLVGALDYGAGFANEHVRTYSYAAYGAAVTLVRKTIGVSMQIQIVKWNDLHGRTKEEVLAVLREAKARALVHEAVPA